MHSNTVWNNEKIVTFFRRIQSVVFMNSESTYKYTVRSFSLQQ